VKFPSNKTEIIHMVDNSVSSEEALPTPESLEKQYRQEVINDYRICVISREASILARREVLTGKAKFGIVGDGKEVPQVAMARAFKKGDWRAGYYRDQTLMMALGLSTVEQFFAQLYADTQNDPFSGGRQMNAHFATPSIDQEGNWLVHTEQYNISSDISSTGGQMARGLGLAFASKKFREHPEIDPKGALSQNGQEVCFCTIGDASTSEGIFWETVNAAGVLQVPLAIAVWDDGYGISVPKKYQTTKESISEALRGFAKEEGTNGIEIYTAKGWDYAGLCELFENGIERMRETHVPALFHIQEVTQPQGHSTSGSHERYKSAERLEWEKQYDCIKIMRQWMIDSEISTAEELDAIEAEAKAHVRESKRKAWEALNVPIKAFTAELEGIYRQLNEEGTDVAEQQQALKSLITPLYSDLVQNARRLRYHLIGHSGPAVEKLDALLSGAQQFAEQAYHTSLYSNSPKSALRIPVVPAEFSENSPTKNGYQILNACFNAALKNHPELFAFGEDLGHIGGVNQGFAGLQEVYGKSRVFDTGIREWSIMGQAIGMAMRGLRPIAEVQYLDYLIYGLEPLSDDLATLRYRSNNQQHAPAIIRTRGHRLEGIWHAGSPLGMILHALRGIYVLVPRNMTQAAGFYNTMLRSDDPALVIECLNGYRLKEQLPDNIGEFTVPLGVPEVLQEGTDVTIVTYGSCVRVAQEAIELLAPTGISVELVDVQSLLPFDLEHRIVESLKKTNRVIFLDEDMPGGATAFMMREVLEVQGGYRYLDSQPVTITAKAHRPPYGSDGDYFSKPNPENIFEAVYQLVYEAEPARFKDSL
jgi:pyruvate/2-oxoglutarate/acetoin dehydrogenase E1 component/TPP-dependent pyruvate/acetoin dehydrogenase alpha subunit